MRVRLTDLSVAEARDGLRTGAFSSVELTQAHLDAIEGAADSNAFITVTPEVALQRASDSDQRRANDAATGSMDGIPIAVKDLFCTEGVLTTAASHILDGFVPTYESTVSAKLRDAGAVMLGKTNLDEFAMGSSTEHSAFGPTRNPWDRDRVPGGSSGGSAAAVAAGSALGALGSDTGGSVRQPAAFCGVVGLRPTYGTVSRYGLVSLASSLDQVGPIARSVADCALINGVIRGRDPRDSSSLDLSEHTSPEVDTGDLQGLRVGIPRDPDTPGPDPEVNRLFGESLDLLRSLGADLEELLLPHRRYGVAVYAFSAAAEAASNLGRYDGIRFGERRGESAGLEGLYVQTRSQGFGPEVKRRILLGTHALRAGYYEECYLQAQKVRTLILDDYAQAFRTVDVICCPTTMTPAFCLGERTENPLEMYQSDVNTVCSSLAGLPAISIPCGFSDGRLPVGLQFTGPAHGEHLLFRAAQAFEKRSGFRNMAAPVAGGGEA